MQDELTTLVNNEMQKHSPGIVSALQKAYTADAGRQDQRLTEIKQTAIRLLQHFRKPGQLPLYFKVAALGEGDARPMTYDEAMQFTGEIPAVEGQDVYHFSNEKHDIGFQGYKKMFFTGEPNLETVATIEIDEHKAIYRHTAKVTKPSLLLCDSARLASLSKRPVWETRNGLIEEYVFMPEKTTGYVLDKPGGISVVNVQKL